MAVALQPSPQTLSPRPPTAHRSPPRTEPTLTDLHIGTALSPGRRASARNRPRGGTASPATDTVGSSSKAVTASSIGVRADAAGIGQLGSRDGVVGGPLLS